MHRVRCRDWVYSLCIAAAILLAAGLFLHQAIPPGPVRFTSRQAASTPSPMMGFAADSVLNTGDAAELDNLPGVGEVIAQRIIDVRQTINGFRIPEDLLLVKGIGEKTLEKILLAPPEPLVVLSSTQEDASR